MFIIYLYFIFLALIFLLAILVTRESNSTKKENRLLEDEVKRLKNLVYSLNRDLNYEMNKTAFLQKSNQELNQKLEEYRMAYKEIAKRNSSNSANLDEDVRAAIKFAMKNSHPDKSTGDAALFMKFHELYKRFCK